MKCKNHVGKLLKAACCDSFSVTEICDKIPVLQGVYVYIIILKQSIIYNSKGEEICLHLYNYIFLHDFEICF